MSDRTPVYRDPVLHFDALHLAALREGGRTNETLATENEKEIKKTHAHLRTYTQLTRLFAAGGVQLTAHS